MSFFLLYHALVVSGTQNLSFPIPRKTFGCLSLHLNQGESFPTVLKKLFKLLFSLLREIYLFEGNSDCDYKYLLFTVLKSTDALSVLTFFLEFLACVVQESSFLGFVKDGEKSPQTERCYYSRFKQEFFLIYSSLK